MEIEKLSGEEFKLIHGSEEEFAILMKWARFYDNHTTKQQFSVEEMIEVVDLISKLGEGTEHGVCSFDQWQASGRKLAELLRKKGYRPWGRWQEGH